jgi:hypothetical protein
MSDNAERFKHYRYGADAPEWGPAFWDGYEDFVSPFDAFAEAWDQFRMMSYTDLQNLHERLKKRAHQAGQKRREVAAEATSTEDGAATQYLPQIENEEVRWLSNTNTYFWQRAKAAAALARYIEELGSPPTWEKLDDAQKESLLGGTDAPRHARTFLTAYHAADGEINSFSDLHEAAANWADDGTDAETWKNRRSNLRDRMNEQGMQWEGRNVHSFMQALAAFGDVADFGDSEEG